MVVKSAGAVTAVYLGRLFSNAAGALSKMVDVLGKLVNPCELLPAPFKIK